MSERNWKREYERTVNAETSQTTHRHPYGEKRLHPRLRPAGVTCAFGINPGMHLIDISDRYVDFYADTAFAIGLRLRMQIEDAPLLDTEVVDCLLEETDPALLEVRYRVRCRILSAPSA